MRRHGRKLNELWVMGKILFLDHEFYDNKFFRVYFFQRASIHVSLWCLAVVYTVHLSV
jgi:hypothetical protein